MKMLTALATFFFLLCKFGQAAYIAEGYFVVDQKALDVYINERTESNTAERRQKAIDVMKKDIEYLLTEVNVLYESFSPRGLDIQISVAKIEFLDKDIFDPSDIYQGVFIDEDTALESFDQWIEDSGAYSKIHYDFASLFTGYDLSGYIVGYSHIGAICDKKMATSVVEFSGTFNTATITAHEVGHTLGSSHDGAASTHIMAATGSADDPDRWSFTVCSTTDILDYIATLQTNCLEDTDSQSTVPSVSPADYTGPLMDPDVICKRTLNDTASYMCKDTNLYNDHLPHGDEVCRTLYCQKPNTNLCYQAYSTDGLVCDVQKRCSGGKCVADDSPQTKNVDRDCLYGDTMEVNLTNPHFLGTCAQYLAKYGVNSCYDDYINEICCGTCAKHNTGVSGCEYGDESSECVDHTPQSICYKVTNRQLCCETCKAYVPGRRRRSLLDSLKQQDVDIVPDKKPVYIKKQKAEVQRIRYDGGV